MIMSKNGKLFKMYNKNKTVFKEYLIRKYFDEKLSPTEISTLLDVPLTTLMHWFKKLDIKLRTRSEALKLHLEKNQDAHQHMSSPFKNPEIQRIGAIAGGKLRKGKTIDEYFGVEKADRLRKLYSAQRTGEKNVNFGKKRPQHVCDALSKAHKGKPQSMEYKIKRLKKAFEALRMSPNKLESRVIDLVNKNNLPFKFVGDGGLVINGMCPDFVSTDDTKMIIEVFGEYWHGNMDLIVTYNRTEEGRQKVLSDLGYQVLIIWEKDMNAMTDDELLNLITQFHNRKG